jgi:hypothetical protein
MSHEELLLVMAMEWPTSTRLFEFQGIEHRKNVVAQAIRVISRGRNRGRAVPAACDLPGRGSWTLVSGRNHRKHARCPPGRLEGLRAAGSTPVEHLKTNVFVDETRRSCAEMDLSTTPLSEQQSEGIPPPEKLIKLGPSASLTQLRW